MAQTGLIHPTLRDLAQAQGPDGMQMRVVEQLELRKPLLKYMVWRETNGTTSHRISRETSLPSGNWKKINQGIQAAKGDQDNIEETCGLLATKSVLDEDLVDLNGGAAYRARQVMRRAAALGNQLESALFYESTLASPERLMGLTPRLNLKSGAWGKQIIDMADYGMTQDGSDKTSIWIVHFADDKVYGIVPKGMQGGLKVKDRGLIEVPDKNGDTFPAWVTNLKWWAGLCVEDARYLVRIANIDMSHISRTGKLLIQALIDGVHQLQDEGDGGNTVIFAHRQVATFLHQQALDTSTTATYSVDTPAGKKIRSVLDLPLLQSDALLLTESLVS